MTLNDINITQFIATFGEFNFKEEEHNQVTLHENDSTIEFPVVENFFTTEIRKIENVVIYENCLK
ncbi:MAG: hypothetical protein PHC38_10395 [Weeksellaceae bacterium]|nr:hypothetical protein [Weeksellaceae bacterium]